MANPQKLSTYRKKRDFSVTSEPKGDRLHKETQNLSFVVQKHAAPHLHYDFRLESAGVLRSWALPKGPSLNSEDKRLAAQTEDHPLDYQNFEGIIPAGEYGAGTVLIWDKGIYELLPKNSSFRAAYRAGHLKINLKGKKLKGEFILQRIKEEDKPQWLLIKLKDKYEDATYDITKKDKSVVSKKTLKEINPDAPYD
jgi:bifunctional non-homologous end joining protein LigD